MQNSPAVGLPWYRPEDWARVKRVMSDADALHDTFEEWQKDARKIERSLRQEGPRVERVMIDVDAFLAWCTIKGRAWDGAARAKYACDAVQRRAQGDG